MKGDLSVVGPQFWRRRRIAASSTRIEVGEPVYSTATMSGGAASTNYYVLVAADFPVIANQQSFGGVSYDQAKPLKTGTIVAHTISTVNPIPHAGLLRGKAETSTNIDTDSELLGILGDAVLIDYNSTGGADGGELYTIKDTASADTSCLAIQGGNISRGTLDVEVYATLYRLNQDVT